MKNENRQNNGWRININLSIEKERKMIIDSVRKILHRTEDSMLLFFVYLN